jgi:hypothetical protein
LTRHPTFTGSAFTFTPYSEQRSHMSRALHHSPPKTELADYSALTYSK